MTTEILEREPILPLKEINLENVYQFWVWYLAPFKRPNVSAQCEAWVLDDMAGKLTDTRKHAWQRQLERAATIRGDASSALTRKPAAIAGDREMYRRKGFLICQRVEGEVGNGEYPYRAYRPDLEGGNGYIGCRQIIAALYERYPWVLAQLTAKRDIQERRTALRGITADQIGYAEDSIGRLDDKIRALKSGSIPLAEELLAFFIRFDRLVLEAGQDVRLKQELALQGRITGAIADEAAALDAARQQLAAVGT